MIRIISIIKNALQKPNLKPPLGRWNIEQCHNKLNNKISRENENECVSCGKYVKNILNKDHKINNII